MATTPTSPPRRGLDPQVVSRLGRLDLKARLVVEGFISGLHKSPFHGFSVEFVEHRQYMPGDPLRSVDWKVYAKSDRFYVKQYEDETNLRAHLVVDHSASMAWASRPGAVTKLEYARSLEGWCGLRRNSFTNLRASGFMPARSGAGWPATTVTTSRLRSVMSFTSASSGASLLDDAGGDVSKSSR